MFYYYLLEILNIFHENEKYLNTYSSLFPGDEE